MAYQEPDPVSGQQPPLVDGGLVLHQLLLLLIVQDLGKNNFENYSLFTHDNRLFFEKNFGAAQNSSFPAVSYILFLFLHKNREKNMCFPFSTSSI